MKRKIIVAVAFVLVLSLSMSLLVACNDAGKDKVVKNYTMDEEQKVVKGLIMDFCATVYADIEKGTSSKYYSEDMVNTLKLIRADFVKELEAKFPTPTHTKTLSIDFERVNPVVLVTKDGEKAIDFTDITDTSKLESLELVQYLSGDYNYNKKWIDKDLADLINKITANQIEKATIVAALEEANNVKNALMSILTDIVVSMEYENNFTAENAKDSLIDELTQCFVRLEKVEGILIKSDGNKNIMVVIYTDVQAKAQKDSAKGYINVNIKNVTNTKENTVLTTTKDGAPLLTGADAKYNRVGIAYDFKGGNKAFTINVVYDKDTNTWQAGLIESEKPIKQYTIEEEKSIVKDTVVNFCSTAYDEIMKGEASKYYNEQMLETLKLIRADFVNELETNFPAPTHTNALQIDNTSETPVILMTKGDKLVIDFTDITDQQTLEKLELMQYLVGDYNYNEKWIDKDGAEYAQKILDEQIEKAKVAAAMAEMNNVEKILMTTFRDIESSMNADPTLTGEYAKDKMIADLTQQFTSLQQVDGILVKSNEKGLLTIIIYTKVQAKVQQDSDTGYINVNKKNVTNTKDNTVIATGLDGAPLLEGPDAVYNSVGTLVMFKCVEKVFTINAVYDKGANTWQAGLIESEKPIKQYTIEEEKSIVKDTVVNFCSKAFDEIMKGEASKYYSEQMLEILKLIRADFVKELEANFPAPTHTTTLRIDFESANPVVLLTKDGEQTIDFTDITDQQTLEKLGLMQYLVGNYDYNKKWIDKDGAEYAQKILDEQIEKAKIAAAVDESNNVKNALMSILTDIVVSMDMDPNLTGENASEMMITDLTECFSSLQQVNGILIKSDGNKNITVVIYTGMQAKVQSDENKGYINVNIKNVTNTMDNTVLTTTKDGAPLLEGADAVYNRIGITYDFSGGNKAFTINAVYDKDTNTWQSGLIA